MARKKNKTTLSAPDDAEPAIARVERLIDELLARQGRFPIVMDMAMRSLRRALDEAARRNVWDLVESMFERAIVLAAEMLTRALLEMRFLLDQHDGRGGASKQFPAVTAAAERFQRILSYVMDTSVSYAKIVHVINISRRRGDDVKIIDFEKAKAARPKKQRRAPRRRATAGRRA